MRDPRRAALAAMLIASACAHGDARVSPAVAPAAGVASAVAPAIPPPSAVEAAPVAAAPAVDFVRDVRPILERRCQPCHFPGGVMYGKLPFDREATMHELGTKLFTRIKDKEEQETIRALLAATAR